MEADLWCPLLVLLLLLFGTPLAGVQCSFQHKAAAGPPSPPSGGPSSSRLGVASQPSSRPHFPASLAWLACSSPNQRSWRQGTAGVDLRTRVRAIRHFLMSQGIAPSFVSWVELAKARSIACAVETVSLGCDQGTSRERRATRAHPPTTDIASSGGDARSRRADLEPQGSRRGCRPPCPPPGQSERVRSHRVPTLHTAREHRIMPRATPS